MERVVIPTCWQCGGSFCYSRKAKRCGRCGMPADTKPADWCNRSKQVNRVRMPPGKAPPAVPVEIPNPYAPKAAEAPLKITTTEEREVVGLTGLKHSEQPQQKGPEQRQEAPKQSVQQAAEQQQREQAARQREAAEAARRSGSKR